MKIESMEGYDRDDDGRWVMPLRNPIVMKSVSVHHLRWREPIARDLRKLRVDESVAFDTILSLAEKLTGQTPMVIDMLSGSDLGEVVGIATFFLDNAMGDGD